MKKGEAYKPKTYNLFDGEQLPMHIQPVYCSYFGCGKELTLQEQLFGDKCVDCKPKVKIDPTYFARNSNKKKTA